MKKIWIFSLFVVLMSADSVYAQNIKADEIKAINAVLGDLYHIGYCERVYDLPYQVCRDDEFTKDILIQSCKSIPKEYRIYDRKAINRNELDVLKVAQYEVLHKWRLIHHCSFKLFKSLYR